MSGPLALLLSTLAVSAVIAGVSAYLYYGRLYVRARVAGAEVGLARMFRMTTSGLSAFRIVTAYLNTRQAGFDAPLDRFEACARAGGDPRQVARRLEAARRRGESLSVDEAFSDED